ncbi:ATP-binding cassette domain-containing protein [Flammeovirga yaeyamensis]|uniref:ATP-binding cassette domain-containing protein n=1 Tax=Flammeovirga yaeyamensis TaxID=367791 RepID=A0AAX1N4C0_9BACT|nr:ABC transporter ATP-binding protein [Flammeovirga yaeyamensis]MBB3698407.1 putative ABC transport system ATP-binding protein [Flammeovirga yaeyamensis]NMF34242.1 ABC transporter ATP-binding protein [Flammeovirga yaeyamensis]QWG01226.1 ATP-binding cassette domain-containing protein [Flammeovirga yaeyamensis]
MNTPLIQINNINKAYKNEDNDTLALHHVTLNIQEGEFVCIMGPSGCGKSTLLNIAGLLDLPTEGEMIFKGQNVVHLSSKKRAQLRREFIGFVFQSFNLIDDLTVFENIELPLIYQQVPPNERKLRVEKMMDQLQISHKKRVFPNQISGGLQQRVAVARALVSNPQLILADEPTGNLDSERGREVMELLQTLNEMGTTILMVTHSTAASDYASRVIHLFDGQIVTENLHKGR